MKVNYQNINPHFPAHGSIEVTTNIGCKIQCEACPQHLLIKNYKKKIENISVPNAIKNAQMMRLDDFKNFLKSVPEKVRIDFSGYSEPFLNPDCIEMIDHANAKGHQISLFTTLVGLDQSGIDKLNFINFHWVCHHIPEKEKTTKVPHDEDHFNLFKYSLDKLNSKKITFSCHGTPLDNYYNEIKQRGFRLFFGDLYDRAGNISRVGSVDLQKYNKPGRKSCRACGNGLNQNVLLPDGKVTLCCQDYGMKHVVGHLGKSSYKEFLNSNELNNIKKRMKNGGDADLLCNTCERAVELPQPHFTIVIPLKNEYENLKILLDSIIEQKFENFEIVLIDYKSNNKTKDLIEQYAYKDNRMHILVLNELDNYFQLAIKEATGEYIIFVDNTMSFKKNSFNFFANLIDKNQKKILHFSNHLKKINTKNQIIKHSRENMQFDIMSNNRAYNLSFLKENQNRKKTFETLQVKKANFYPLLYYRLPGLKFVLIKNFLINTLKRNKYLYHLAVSIKNKFLPFNL